MEATSEQQTAATWQPAITSEFVEREFERAQRTLEAALCKTDGARLLAPYVEVLRPWLQLKGWRFHDLRRPAPTGDQVVAMIRAFTWLHFLPADRPQNLIVRLRSITNPSTGKPLSWERIARRMRADRRAVRTAWIEAIGKIVLALTSPASEQETGGCHH